MASSPRQHAAVATFVGLAHTTRDADRNDVLVWHDACTATDVERALMLGGREFDVCCAFAQLTSAHFEQAVLQACAHKTFTARRTLRFTFR